ncbi:MAG: hypothetical protein ACIARR_09645 [Phycisphaerales bacterium JB059]
MTHGATQPAIRMPMQRLICVELLAWLVAGALAVGVVSAMGHANGAVMGAGATLVGLIAGLLVVGMTPEREAFRWAMVQVAASSVRMLATLAIGFGLYKSLEPDKIGLWAPLLLTSLAVLAAEVMVFLPVLRGADAGARADGSVTEASA